MIGGLQSIAFHDLVGQNDAIVVGLQDLYWTISIFPLSIRTREVMCSRRVHPELTAH